MQGRVHLQVNGTRARAKVEGTEKPTYGVGLDWSRVASDRVLHVFCECERFVGGTPCKHVWATLLELASTNADSQPPGKDRVSMRKDRVSSWSELGIESDPAKNQAQAAANTNQKRRRSRRPRKSRKRGSGTATWRNQFNGVETAIAKSRSPKRRGRARQQKQEIQLLINTSTSESTGELVLDLFGRNVSSSGDPGRLKRIGLELDELETVLSPAEPADSEHLVELVAALPPETQQKQQRGRRGRSPSKTGHQRVRLPRLLFLRVVADLCERGLLASWDGRRLGDPEKLKWDDGAPWHMAIHLEFAAAKRMRLRGLLVRGEDQIALSNVQLVLPPKGDKPSFVIFQDTIARFETNSEGDIPWLNLLREAGEVVIPEEDLEEALTALLESPGLPKIEAPEELQLEQQESEPQPRLVLKPEDAPEWMNPQLVAALTFSYGKMEVNAGDPRPAVIDWDERTFARRDLDEERAALVRLLELGLKPTAGGKGDGLELDPQQLPIVAEPLLLDGWEVEAHGVSMRPPNPPALKVESGIDWFEVSGQVDFDGDPVELSKVLEAIARGERTVELEDGSQGLLPEAWMDTYDSLAKLAQDSTENGLRFLPSQALLVDALLATMPPANVDRAFGELREKLQTFESIKPKKEPRGFSGELRSYQRMGLGWLCFLREFGLGGVLADDMGLGKTVQALAMLRTYRTPAKSSKLPYLVVAPRSLVYNWIDEAGRFTPNLKVTEYGGPDREGLRAKLDTFDLVLTTYGTLRRDIGYLATVEFDTVILDEAQAIKNPESQTAKACRLLNSRHRLALTGTPIENHLGELGSIFEFLNPGLLGRLPALEVLAGGREASKEELALVAKGIRPFILRRTKSEVLKDLPEKTEQVLQCELSEQQRELYDQLRASYRDSLLKHVEDKGMASSTMQVLEALLRLRQVACHPGLVNPEWEEAGSAKLESLFEQTAEVMAEGHKLVIFSQFTKLLAYVRKHLDGRGMEYAYLDGQTTNRGEVVERFQSDPSCNLFLISLKAGGVGLNLTAASYVFLLDPWWNPAVEAQAIDRTHRIGQTQPVFAYRLIAKDTVEEKMVELQRSKRQLADAILDGGGEGQSLRDLTADDLKLLLS